MTTHDFVIEAEGLTRYFGKKRAVDSVSLQVPRGSVFSFLGRNGSGKTTTIRMLLGFLLPTSGTARVLGQDSRRLSPATRGHIGYVSESYCGYERMTVAQEGEFLSKFHRRWDQGIFQTVVDRFGLSPAARVRTLSLGERAGLSLAITLAPQPELLILDDPAIGLDPVARRSLLETMLHVTRGSDRTIFFSSHQLDDVEFVADYVAILDQSVLRTVGPVDEVAAGLRQYLLVFAPGTMPRALPPLRGLLSTKRIEDRLIVTVAQPGDDTRATLATLAPVSIKEQAVSFSDAVVSYLSASQVQGSFLEQRSASAAGGF